jgi:hypothetical protein
MLQGPIKRSVVVIGLLLCVFATMPPASAADVTATITPNGAAVAKSTTTADQNIVLSFSLAAAGKVSVRYTDSSFSGGSISIVDSTPTTRSSRSLLVGAGYLEAVLLTAGSYIVVIDPSGSQVGSVTTELFSVSDVTGTIAADGTSTAKSTTRPGQEIRLRFSATAGQRVALRVANVAINGTTLSIPSCCAAAASILRPNGTTLRGPTNVGTTAPGFIDTVTLPTTGTYTVLLDPDRDTVLGTITANLWTVPADATAPVTTNGAAVVSGTTTPGQDVRLTFTGAVNDRISYKISNIVVSGPSQAIASCCAVDVSLRRPSGAILGTSSSVGTSGGRFVEPLKLPVAGTYTLLISPQKDTVLSSVTASVWNVPADVTSAIATSGAPLVRSTTAPGQNIRLTFSGTMGDRISFRVASISTAGPSLAVDGCCALEGSLLKPDGTTLVGRSTVGTTAARFFEPVTLPVTGTYTVLLDPRVDAVITSVTTNVWAVPADVTTPITANGSPLTSATTTPGQDIRLTFSGSTGQRVSLRVDGVTVSGSSLATTSCCAVDASILRPNGTVLVASTSVGTSAARFFDAVALPVNGTYTVLLSPQKDTVVSSITAKLWTVPTDLAFSGSVGGGGVAVSTTTPGQNATLTFSGTAGQSVTIAFSGVSVGPGSLAPASAVLKASVRKPDATTLVSPTSVGTSGKSIPATLPANGTYTLVIDPQFDAVANATVTIT